MDVYDLLMILVVGGATVFGAVKGMAWQVASISSLVVSFFVALGFRYQLAPLFGDSEPWNRVVAMLVIYLVTSMAIWLAFRLVSGFIDRLKLKEFDRQVGAIFGFTKGVLLCVLITVFAVGLLPEKQRESVLGSRSGYYAAVILDKADAVMPGEVHEVVGPYIHRAQKTLDPGAAPHEGHDTHIADETPEALRDTIDRAAREGRDLLERAVTELPGSDRLQ